MDGGELVLGHALYGVALDVHIIHVKRVAHVVIILVIAPGAAGGFVAGRAPDFGVRERLPERLDLRVAHVRSGAPEPPQPRHLRERFKKRVRRRADVAYVQIAQRRAAEQRRRVLYGGVEELEPFELLEIFERRNVVDKIVGQNEMAQVRHVRHERHRAQMAVAKIERADIAEIVQPARPLLMDVHLEARVGIRDEIVRVGRDEEHIDAERPHERYIRKRLLQRAHLLIGETAVGHIDTANARQSGERFGYLRAGVLDLYAAQVDLLIVPADGDAVKLDRRGRRGRARRRRRRRCGRRRLIYYDGGGGRFVRAARAKNTKRGCGKE